MLITSEVSLLILILGGRIDDSGDDNCSNRMDIV
jgi:hypothetical protein